jgi:hypothetical protein
LLTNESRRLFSALDVPIVKKEIPKSSTLTIPDTRKRINFSSKRKLIQYEGIKENKNTNKQGNKTESLY